MLLKEIILPYFDERQPEDDRDPRVSYEELKSKKLRLSDGGVGTFKLFRAVSTDNHAHTRGHLYTLDLGWDSREPEWSEPPYSRDYQKIFDIAAQKIASIPLEPGQTDDFLQAFHDMMDDLYRDHK